MSYPILYSATERYFDHNGLGILGNCVSCEVTEELNGIFELAMQYPMDGIHFDEIVSRSIIKASPDKFRNAQLFRVYHISKPNISGIVNISAQHISYDLSGIPVKPFSAHNAASALIGLKSNAIVDCPFDFWTNKATEADFNLAVPASIRSCLGGVDGSILSVYRGEYEFDNYTVRLYNNRGSNRGVSIRYGKNLTNIKQDENCSNVVTGVYPYWKATEGSGYVELPEKIVNTPGTHDFVKVNVLDFSQAFESEPTVDQLRAHTEAYIREHELGVPIVSLTVSFAQLAQSEEYKHLDLLERVSMGDTVNVEFPALNVSSNAKAVKIVYDVLMDRVKSVTLGSVRANIADTIVEQQKEIQKLPSKSFLELAIESLTNNILGAKGGSVRLLDTDEDGEPDTLYIADNPDPEKAVKVWRFNYEGWGASDNGYVGPFKMGATFDSGIVAEFITAGTLYGMLLKAGAIESDDGKIRIDLDDTSNTAYFDAGIQSNSFKVRPEGEPLLFRIESARSGSFNNQPFFYMEGYRRDGTALMRMSEEFDRNGNPMSIAFNLFGNGYESYANLNSDYQGGEFHIKGQNAETTLRSSAGNALLRLRSHEPRIELQGSDNNLFAIGFSDFDGAYINLPPFGEMVLDISTANDDGSYNLIVRPRNIV